MRVLIGEGLSISTRMSGRKALLQVGLGWQHGQQYFRNLLDNRAYLVLIVEEHGEVVGYLAGATSEAGALWAVLYAELERTHGDWTRLGPVSHCCDNASQP